MPRSHKLRAARRRRALPRTQNEKSGVPASVGRGAPATNQSCFRQLARAARRAEMPCSHKLRAARRRRSLTRSQNERSGVPASIGRGAPATSQSCFRQLGRAGSCSEASRDAAQPQAAGGKTTTRAATLSKQVGREDSVETRRRAHDEPKLFPALRGEQTCRAATSCGRQDDDAHCHALNTGGAG